MVTVAETIPGHGGEHFADAERILAALPLVKRSTERERHVRVALVHAVLAIAASLGTNGPIGILPVVPK